MCDRALHGAGLWWGTRILLDPQDSHFDIAAGAGRERDAKSPGAGPAGLPSAPNILWERESCRTGLDYLVPHESRTRKQIFKHCWSVIFIQMKWWCIYSTLPLFTQSIKMITSCYAFYQWMLCVDGFDWYLAFTNITNMIIQHNILIIQSGYVAHHLTCLAAWPWQLHKCVITCQQPHPHPHPNNPPSPHPPPHTSLCIK